MRLVHLINKHIIIDHQLAENLFEGNSQVNWVYYPARHTILVAAQHDDHFKSLHKTAMSMLKFKNSKGDRSMAIEELLIDHDINVSDRALDYVADDRMKILSIILPG